MSEGGAGAARRREPAHHADAAAHDAVAVPAAQTRLCKAKGGASEKAGALAPLRIKAGKTHASATRPRLRTGLGDGEPESRRPQARNAGKRQKRTWHALQQADVEVHPASARRARVSGGGGSGGNTGRRPAATHSSHSTDTPSMRLKGKAAVVCQSCGLRRIRLLSVSRMRLFWP